jgi:hypothetical protein
MINLIHQPSKANPEKVYERIAAVMPMMKGMTCPPQHNPSMEFSVLEFDREKFMTLPSFLQEMITGSKEYLAMMSRPTPAPAAPVKSGFEQNHGQVVTNATEQRTLTEEIDELPF